MSIFTEQKNRQAQRSIDALQNALVELMNEKPFQKITITEIADRSGLTRSTFYAHFETKDALLESIVNDILDVFFESLHKRNIHKPDPVEDLEINRDFFRAWQNNKHMIELLNSVDFDCLLISRMNAYWREHFLVLEPILPEMNRRYSGFTLNFLAYACVGLLKEWIRQDMSPSPEVMGELLYFFTGPPTLIEARKKFKDKF